VNLSAGFGQVFEHMVYQLARADDEVFYLPRTVWIDRDTKNRCKKSKPGAMEITYHRPIHLSPSICLVFMALLAHRSSKTGQSKPSVTRICELTGIERRTVQYGLRYLEAKSLIRVEHVTGRGNVYTI